MRLQYYVFMSMYYVYIYIHQRMVSHPWFVLSSIRIRDFTYQTCICILLDFIIRFPPLRITGSFLWTLARIMIESGFLVHRSPWSKNTSRIVSGLNPNRTLPSNEPILNPDTITGHTIFLEPGIVPKAFRIAETIPIRKPRKESYYLPKAWPLITLLNTFGKFLEAAFYNKQQRNIAPYPKCRWETPTVGQQTQH